MMNAGNLNGKARQMKDWRRRLVALVAALSLLISSCGLTAFAESDEDIYSAPVTAPIAPANTSPEPEEGGAEVTPAPEGQDETGTEPAEETGEETGTEPVEETGEETGTEPGEEGTEGEPEVSEEPEDLTVYESGTLTAEADGINVTLDYAPEARIPEGAVLTLARATGGDLYSTMKAAARVLKEEVNEIWKRELGDEAVFYLLTLTTPEGIELHPTDGLTLTCTNLSIPAGSTGFVTGTSAENIDWDGELTLAFLPDAIGYANLKQVQIGTITLVHNDRDYMVTASYGPEAGFPVGTALKVREIMPGTPEYALYSGMTDEALNEDWSEITLERYFDIAFVKDDEELEPQAEVDVQITFRDKIEENEDTEVAAVHIENNEATVIESETDSQKVAKHDDEAIDTVTFTSDSFSVYGVVQKKKIITKILEAGGQTYEIGVTYTQEAEIPEDAQIKVEEIPEGSDLYNAYKKQTAAALNADDVRLPGLYDISIVDAENNKVEPKVPVSVAIKLLNDENTTEDIQIVHFKEDIPQELVEAEAVAQQDAQTEETTVEQTEDKPQEQTEVQNQPLAEEDKIESEEIKAKVEGDTVTFETQSFSVYAFAYTVDFYYGEYEYHMSGGGVMTLSELFAQLHIDRNVADVAVVEFTNSELISVSKIEEDTTVKAVIEELGLTVNYSTDLTEEGIEEFNSKQLIAVDWVLISLEPFTSIESLTIKFVNGDTIVIQVEDDQYDFEVMVNDKDAGYIDKAGSEYYLNYATNVSWNNGKVVGFQHKLNERSPGFYATGNSNFSFLFWLKIDKDWNITKLTKDTLAYPDCQNPDGSYTGVKLIAFFAPSNEKVIIVLPYDTSRGTVNNLNKINNNSSLPQYIYSNSGKKLSYTLIHTEDRNPYNGQNQWAGRYFKGWYSVDGSLISTASVIDPKEVSDNTIVKPIFEDAFHYNVVANEDGVGEFYIPVHDPNWKQTQDRKYLQTENVLNEGVSSFKWPVLTRPVAGKNYEFVYWIKDDGTFPIAEDEELYGYVDSNGKQRDHYNQLNRNTTYVAFFKPQGDYLVRVNYPAEGGSTSGSMNPRSVKDDYSHNELLYYYAKKDSPDIIATPANSDWAFVGWYHNGTELISTSSTFNLGTAVDNGIITKDLNLTPIFKHRTTVFNVWFDGTNGIGGGSANNNTFYTRIDGKGRRYGSSSEFMQVSKDDPDAQLPSATITLPTSAATPQNSNLTLQGWYNVYTGEYYKPGAQATIHDDSVFYADWFPATYNIGQNNSLASQIVDTNGFITTRMFDYNNLINMNSIYPDRGQAIIPTQSANGDWTKFNKEYWHMNGNGSDFVFIDTVSGQGRSMNPYDRDYKNQNRETSTDGSYFTATPTTGLFTDALKTRLFGTGDVVGKRYLGTGNYLYRYNDSTGYYFYDSDVNAASYNKDAGRFYVYNYTNKTNKSNNGDNTDFLPLNYGSGTFTEAYGQPDYWFGMSSTIRFYLPNDVNKTSNEHNPVNLATDHDNREMIYKFAGDDDVWVFVDGQLVLDMGGIHGKVYGEINFSRGTWTVVSDGAGKTVDTDGIMTYVENTGKKIGGSIDLLEGDHTLTLYYLERGGSQSNCAIYFNLAPRYSMELTKVDNDNTGLKLSGAVFGIYSDADCTLPASVWATGTDDTSTNIFTTDSNGLISVGGLAAGHTYYIKELNAPSGYPDISEDVITLTLSQDGNTITATSTADVDSWHLADVQKNGKLGIQMTVKNKQTTSITVKKVWATLDGKTSRINPNSVDVKLQRYSLVANSSGTTTQHAVHVITRYFGDGTQSYADDSKPVVEYQTSSYQVDDGGSISFEVTTSGTTAIYSVSSQYGRPSSYQRSNYTTARAYKVFGNYVIMPQKVTFSLNNITRETNIYLTYIGDADSGEQLIANTAVSTPEIKSGNGEARIKQEDTTFNSSSEYTATLNSGNNWTARWDNLASGTGGNPYYYYIMETNPSVSGINTADWGTSYLKLSSSNGLSSGTVTVNNVLNALKVKMIKRDKDDNTHYLPGAKFLLYTKEEYEKGENRQPINMNNNTGLLDDNAYITSGDTKLTSQSNGLFYSGYIPLGEYVLVETDAPEGYQKLTTPFYVQLTKDTIYGKPYGSTEGWIIANQADGNGYYNLVLDNTPFVKITVQKAWSDQANYYGLNSIALKLIRYKKSTSQTVPEPGPETNPDPNSDPIPNENTDPNPDSQSYGTLIINHLATGYPGTTGTTTLPSGFIVSYSYNDGTDHTVNSGDQLPSGRYTIIATVSSDSAPNGYSCSTTTSALVNIPDGGTDTASFTSTYIRDTGTLSITHVAAGLSSTLLPDGFSATYSYNDGTTTVTGIEAGNHIVPTGTYTVTSIISNPATPTGYNEPTTNGPITNVIVSKNGTGMAEFVSTYSEEQGSDETCTVSFRANYSSNGEGNLGLSYKFPKKSKLLLNYNSVSTANNQASWALYYKTPYNYQPVAGQSGSCPNGNGVTIELGEEDVYIVWINFDENFVMNHLNEYNFSLTRLQSNKKRNNANNKYIRFRAEGGGSSPSGSAKTTIINGSVYTVDDEQLITLSKPSNSAQDWSIVVNNLCIYDDNNEPYYYYIEEIEPFGYEVSYTPTAPVIATQTEPIVLKATNTLKKGALTIEKQLLLNGEPNNKETKSFNFGVYTNSAGNGTQVATGTINLNNQSTGKVTISDLDYGTYYVFELNDSNQPITGESGTIGGVTYHVTSTGSSVAVKDTTGGTEADVIVTNDETRILTGSLALRKIVSASEDAPINGDLTKTDGTYFFTVADSTETVIKYIAIKATSTANAATPPEYSTVYTYKVSDEEILSNDDSGFVEVPAQGVVISGLAPGSYTITEATDNTNLTSIIYGTRMQLDDLTVTAGNADKDNATATVSVEAGNTASVPTATFTNKLVPVLGSLKITKVVTDGSENNSDALTGTYKFSVNGKEKTSTAGITHTVDIIFEKGFATSYKIDGVEADAEGIDNTYSVIIRDLVIGEYIVEETDSDTLALQSITGGTSLSDNSVSATVSEDVAGTASTTVEVVFTNTTYDTIDINATKQFPENTAIDQQPKAIRFELFTYTDNDVTKKTSVNPTTERPNPVVIVRDSNNEWGTATWTELDKYVNRTDPLSGEIKYLVEETGVFFGELVNEQVPADKWIINTTDPGYERVQMSDMYQTIYQSDTKTDGTVIIDPLTEIGAITVTNVPKKINIPVSKQWDVTGDGFTWKIRVQLTSDHDEVGDEPQVIEFTENTAEADRTFKNLPKYKNGEEVHYSVKEIFYELKDANGATVVASTDTSYEPTYSYEQEDGEGNVSLTITNEKKTNRLVVRKKWIDVLNQDLTELPTVYFRVKYYFNDAANDLTNHSNWHDAEINGESGTIFALGADNQPNAWEWICPVDLPAQIDDRDVTYFVEEVYSLQRVDDHDNIPCAEYDSSFINFTKGFEEYQKSHIKIVLDGYENDEGTGSSHWQYPYEAGLDGEGQETVSGIITIRNSAPSEYMQFDIKKKFLEYDSNGALWTTTSFATTKSGLVLEVQLYRRIVEDRPITIVDHDVTSDMNDYIVLQDFTKYGNPMYVGYDDDGVPGTAVADSNGNLFKLRRGEEGDWHWTVDNTVQNKGLPRYGLYNGTPVRYEYLLVEEAAYKNKKLEPLDDYNWVAVLPAAWDGIDRGGSANEIIMFPLAIAQDQDRIMNIRTSDLKITKRWENVSADRQKVLVKVYRTYNSDYPNEGNPLREDYTNILNSPRDIMISKYGSWSPTGAIFKEGALDTGHIFNANDGKGNFIVLTGNESVTINNVQEVYQGNVPYRYWVEEVGYLDAEGTPHYVSNPFSTTYDKGSNSYEIGFNNPPGVNISPVIGIKGRNNGKNQNELIIKNTVATGSLEIQKILQLNGEVTDDSKLNGTYTFTIVSGSGVTPSVDKTVMLSFADGILTGAKIRDTGSTEEAATLELTEGKVIISGLPAGQYTVTEDQSTLKNGIHLVNTTPVSVTVAASPAEIPTATFTNNMPYVEQVPAISKELNGEAFSGTGFNGNPIAFEFTLTQVVAPVEAGNAGYTETKQSENDGSISFASIGYTVPGEYIYSIAENGTDNDSMDYDNKVIYAKIVVSYENENNPVKLVASEPTYYQDQACSIEASAVFNNIELGELNLKKLVVAPEDSGADQKEFIFEITLSLPEDVNLTTVPVSINGGTPSDYTVTNDVVTVTLKHNETARITKLPVGTTYSITETNGAGYTLTWTDGKGSSGTITKTPSYAEVTNTLNETDVKLIKIDSKTKEQISGATFQLKKYDGNDYVDDGGPIIVNGEYLFEDLLDGDYQLVEIDVPAGYIKQDITISFSIADGTVDYEDTPDDLIDYEPAKDENPAAFTVSNIAGAELPSTGGSGTLIYTIAGMALVVLAGVLLVSRRKKRT